MKGTQSALQSCVCGPLAAAQSTLCVQTAPDPRLIWSGPAEIPAALFPPHPLFNVGASVAIVKNTGGARWRLWLPRRAAITRAWPGNRKAGMSWCVRGRGGQFLARCRSWHIISSKDSCEKECKWFLLLPDAMTAM